MDNFDRLFDHIRAESLLVRFASRRSRKLLEKTLEHWPANGDCMDARNTDNANNLCGKAGFSPVIWGWLAKLIVEMLVRWWANRGIGTIEGARQELKHSALRYATESD